MRGRASGLIVAGVVVLAALAAVDALRSEGEVQRAPGAGTTTTRTTTTGKAPTLAETLRREAITGFVLYSDTDCRLHTLALPSMDEFVVRKEGTNEPVRRCTFAMDGGRLLADDEVISPDRTYIARCRRGHVEVRDSASGRLRSRIRGCAPAWRPDGTLTYARDGRVLLGGRTVLLSRDDLRAAARRNPNVGGLGPGFSFRVRVTDISWLDAEHLLVSVEIPLPYGEVQPLAALFHGTEIVGVVFGQPLRHWIVSSAGSFAAAADGTIIARNGDAVDPPQALPDGTAVAFSPDEQWLVYVTGVSVYFVGTPRNSEPARIIRLPIPAQDFEWDPSA